MEENKTIETTEPIELIEPAEPISGLEQNKPSWPMRHKFFTMAVVGMIAGMVGGVYGALSLAQRPAVQKLFNAESGSSGAISQNVILQEESAITSVVEKTSKAVVSIVISRQISNNYPFSFGDSMDATQQVGAGSGFFVSADGLILTNKHVVNDTRAQYTVITNEGKKYEARVLTVDPSNDLAIMKVDISNAPFLEFADSDKVQLGQHVIAIGNSLGEFQNTVTSGVISGLSRNIIAGDLTGTEQLQGVLQTDAAINPGNSGGPLLNLVGRVVGVNTAVASGGQSVGFAIPANDAKMALDSYNRSGKIARPFLGVRYMLLSEEIAEQMNLGRNYGALLIRGDNPADFSVVPGSPADSAGLKEGDIILELNGTQVNEDNSLSSILKDFKPGDRITAKVYTNGEERSIPITLGEID